ncbi:MAG TPA: respiratory nitrate reductase subunit gamma, partial [Terriglobia bacterium]|nr:respiratory nitrate reductase subunit gamma [Terriglobia bacterium]
LSSQFLENRQHFWGLVPFHYGVLAVLAGHVIAFLFPRELLLWNSVPLRLYILEVSALVFALLTLVGLISAIVRRAEVSKVRRVTTLADWIVYGQLLFQVISGIYIAVFHPWGSSWFASAVTPYLRSLLLFNPQIGYIAALPVMVKLHIVSAFVLIGFFPFTRLVHILVVPNPYLWRRPQVVRWYRAPGRSTL